MSIEILSRFRDKPATRAGWWAMGLGLAAAPMSQGLLAMYSSMQSSPALTIRRLADAAGLCGLALFLADAVGAVWLGCVALRKAERSAAVWTGLALGALSGLFILLFIAGELAVGH
jgi:hypothetical protein